MNLLAAVLVLAQLTAFIALAVRGLARHYPALMAYLASSMVRTLALGLSDPVVYRDLWMWTLPVVLLMQVLVGVEFYRRSFSELPGLRARMHAPILVICLLAATWVMFPSSENVPTHFLWKSQQAVAIVLFLACLGSALLVPFLRPWRRRNVVIHERILAMHFLTVLWLTMYPKGGLWNGVISIACCLAWALLLRTEGEVSLRPPRHPDIEHHDADDLTDLSRNLWGVFRPHS